MRRSNALLLGFVTLALTASVVLYWRQPKAMGQWPPIDATLRIDVNSADAATLGLLPGIGPTLAKRIVDDRLQNGRFTTVDNLQRVTRIGPKTLAAIAPYVVCGQASEAAGDQAGESEDDRADPRPSP